MAKKRVATNTGKKTLTRKQRSALDKQASAGKDIGRRGKMFDVVSERAARKYGSAEAGRRVAAAAMFRGRAARSR